MTTKIPYILIGVAPGIIWLAYCFIVNRRETRSFESVFRVFLWSASFTFPTSLLEQALNATIIKPTIQETLVSGFLMIAPLEEFFKLLAVWIGAYRQSDFRSPVDGVTYAVTAALGFVVIENAMYISRLGPSIMVSRLLYATPAHILFSFMWGYSLGIARFMASGEIFMVSKGFVFAVLFHGAYNILVALAPAQAKIVLAPYMALLVVIAIVLFRKLLHMTPYADLGGALLVICPGCEAFVPESLPRCQRCGFDLSEPDIDSPRFCWKCHHEVSRISMRCPRCFVRLRPKSKNRNMSDVDDNHEFEDFS
ncbi:MAG: PrsW family glutamic-type intramembrane protease [Desulfomonilaceae bacterium]